MIEIRQRRNLTQIYARGCDGREKLIGSQRVLRGRIVQGHRSLHLIPAGDGKTLTSRFQVGSAPARRHVLAVEPHEVVKAFREAGMDAPAVVAQVPLVAAVTRMHSNVVALAGRVRQTMR